MHLDDYSYFGLMEHMVFARTVKHYIKYLIVLGCSMRPPMEVPWTCMGGSQVPWTSIEGPMDIRWMSCGLPWWEVPWTPKEVPWTCVVGPMGVPPPSPQRPPMDLNSLQVSGVWSVSGVGVGQWSCMYRLA